MAKTVDRQGIFLSHATTPADNAFTLWLGGKLSALGYDVWADIFRLKGGDDWERVLENAIRSQAAKVLVAANPESVSRQGVRNEIKIALDTGRKIEDSAFVIPLRLADYESPYLVAHAQWVDFKDSWASGLSSLVETLEGAGVPRPGTTERTTFWKELQLGQGRDITAGPETLVSNWLQVKQLPKELFFYDFAAGISVGSKDAAIRSCPLPQVPYGRGFIAFAPKHQLQEHFGEALPLQLIGIVTTSEYGAQGAPSMAIEPMVARRHLVDLMRRGLERHFDMKGLQHTELASERRMWWPDKALVGMEQRTFAWPDGPSGRRQMVGQSKARNVYWHYGISCWPATSPLHHIRLSGHVIFTVDGRSIVGDARRMHTMRRTLCRSWRNDRWRDLLLSFLFWLGDGQAELSVDLGQGAEMLLDLPTMMLEAGFGLSALQSADDSTGELAADYQELDVDEGDALQESDDSYEADDDEDLVLDGDQE